MSNVVPLNPEHLPPAQSSADLVAFLRSMADGIEGGDLEGSVHVSLILLDKNRQVRQYHRTVHHMTQMEYLGMLTACQHQILREHEEP